jgi:hypothetical protein
MGSKMDLYLERSATHHLKEMRVIFFIQGCSTSRKHFFLSFPGFALSCMLYKKHVDIDEDEYEAPARRYSRGKNQSTGGINFSQCRLFTTNIT